MEKVIKNASSLNKLLNIGIVIVLVCLLFSVKDVFSIVGTDESLFLLETSITDNLLEVKGSYIGIQTDNPLDISFLQEKSDVKTAIVVWQVLNCIAISIAFISLYALKKILSCILQSEPFQGGISGYIMLLGWGVIGNQLFIASMHSISTFMCKILIDDFYRGASFLFKPELLFTWFVFSTLSAVFRYGEELQKQADDTV